MDNLSMRAKHDQAALRLVRIKSLEILSNKVYFSYLAQYKTF